MDRLTELRDTVAYLQAELESIHESAAERSLTADEQTAFDDGVFVRDAAIAEGIELEKREHAIASVRAGDLTRLESGDSIRDRGAPAFHGEKDPYDPSYRAQVGDHEAAKRAVGTLPGEKAQADAADKLSRNDLPEMRQIARHILAFGSPDYAKAFGKASLGQEAEMTPAERGAWQFARTESRAMGLTDAAGGYAIPVHLDPSIIDTREGSINPFRQISTVVSVTGDTWGGVTSAGVSVAYGTEFAVATDGSAVLTNPTITPAKGSGFVPISIEGAEDIAGIGTWVAQSFANARDDLDATIDEMLQIIESARAR